MIGYVEGTVGEQAQVCFCFKFLPRDAKTDRYWGSSTPLLFCVTLYNTLDLVMQCKCVSQSPFPSHRPFDLQAVPCARTSAGASSPSPSFSMASPPSPPTFCPANRPPAASANHIAFRKWRNVNQDPSTRLLILIPYVLTLPTRLNRASLSRPQKMYR
jgi:hypothetical protein